ncbi:hypothetical protein BKA62DRAFT_771942 [Auriculariales sp. MPI-PUGE-AT-0066]|nr:hypothetical protein BKA62DRAFT_771942 [Auriculariales sp. MPI-PUGE-AT-0066]
MDFNDQPGALANEYADGFQPGDISTQGNAALSILQLLRGPATHAAIATAHERWNQARHGQRNITEILPPEIIVQCFMWLSTIDRMNATEVSRAWRRIVVNSPMVWSNARVTKLVHLKLVRARHGTTPVTLELFGSPFATNPIMRDLAPYVISLRIWNEPHDNGVASLNDALSHAFPLLQVLIISGQRWFIKLPLNWPPPLHERAPVLRVLRVRTFEHSTRSPYQSHGITDFFGICHPHLDFNIFLNSFPNLVTLELLNFRTEMMQLSPIYPPPASLINLILDQDSREKGVSYRDLAEQRWNHHTFQKVCFAQPQSLQPLLRLFSSRHGRSSLWGMIITIYHPDAEDGTRSEVVRAAYGYPSPELAYPSSARIGLPYIHIQQASWMQFPQSSSFLLELLKPAIKEPMFDYLVLLSTTGLGLCLFLNIGAVIPSVHTLRLYIAHEADGTALFEYIDRPAVSVTSMARLPALRTMYAEASLIAWRVKDRSITLLAGFTASLRVTFSKHIAIGDDTRLEELILRLPQDVVLAARDATQAEEFVQCVSRTTIVEAEPDGKLLASAYSNVTPK